MSMAPSNETKLKEKRCTQLGAGWIPWIKVNEFSSLGTRSLLVDWKTGRQVHCLSLGERAAYLILRWNDEVKDINEQVVLDRNRTDRIAKELGFRQVNYNDSYMTTDFRVFYTDDDVKALSFKNAPIDKDNPRNRRLLERLEIERVYWVSQGIPWDQIYGTELNYTLASNIDLVTRYYDRRFVFDEASELKHLIATKQVVVDMESEILEIERMVKHG